VSGNLEANRDRVLCLRHRLFVVRLRAGSRVDAMPLSVLGADPFAVLTAPKAHFSPGRRPTFVS
jgi:hypothetical protein